MEHGAGQRRAVLAVSTFLPFLAGGPLWVFRCSSPARVCVVSAQARHGQSGRVVVVVSRRTQYVFRLHCLLAPRRPFACSTAGLVLHLWTDDASPGEDCMVCQRSFARASRALVTLLVPCLLSDLLRRPIRWLRRQMERRPLRLILQLLCGA